MNWKREKSEYWKALGNVKEKEEESTSYMY